MWPKTKLTEALGIEYPIVLAPMTLAITNEIIATPALVAAVSNKGGLGIFGAGVLEPEELRTNIRQIAKLTDKPFGVNLLVPYDHGMSDKQVLQRKVEVSRKLLLKVAVDQGILDTEPPQKKRRVDLTSQMFPYFAEKLDVCIQEKVPVVQFSFGIPSFKAILKCKKNDIMILGTCTCVKEAKMFENAGADVLVVQGLEAGGQRAVFLADEFKETNMLGHFVLVPLVRKELPQVPIIACGGIMDGRSILASCILGADGVMMGTAFMEADESGLQDSYKKVLKEEQVSTVLTRSFTGRPARALANQYVQQADANSVDIPLFPVQHNLCMNIMREAASRGNAMVAPIFVGQGFKDCRRAPADEIFSELTTQVETLKQQILDTP
mmetsp:Transcript_5288/g.5757  ORF Transcript_5288/g.5757 Transcript_5288/m.5757 type:complete len:381 (+) Transcript_5288:74-1216(+)